MTVVAQLVILGSAVGAVALAASNNVPNTVRPADLAAASALIGPSFANRGRPEAFDEQVELVLKVQDSVLTAAPIDKGIPQGQPRELPDLVRYGYGLCFDRSRAIETVLRHYGFETRHAAVYSTVEAGSALKALASPSTRSHAVTEVLTSRGWMVVDSNRRWIGLSKEGRPVDLSKLRDRPEQSWHPIVQEAPFPTLRESFTWVYGLYSRHGKFYPPYTPVPDVNWAELTENI